MVKKDNFVGLIILDGFGLTSTEYGNAISIGDPENLYSYMHDYSFTTLEASGQAVGLPAGQMGNSEVGHLNIGAGRVVYQAQLRIQKSIEDDTLKDNKEIVNLIKYCKAGHKLHLMGLLSDIGVHAHMDHLFYLMQVMKDNNIPCVIHAITDGRDSYREDGVKYLARLAEVCAKTNCTIGTIAGRYYTMDRESNYNLVYRAYENMTRHTGHRIERDKISDFMQSMYKQGIYDEFIEPGYIVGSDTIEDRDAVLFYNYREDRGREFTHLAVEGDIPSYPKIANNLYMVTMTVYDKTFRHVHPIFKEEVIPDNLSAVISHYGLNQFKISETTKYAHVTYFLNGGIEAPYEGEDRVLIETLKNTPFDAVPQMRAVEITDEAIRRILSKKYQFMALNYSNCDMIGHTGNLEAAAEAVSVIDRELKRLVDAILSIGGTAVITADHGNCEVMRGENGRVLTEHTTNLVPFIIVSDKKYDLKSGGSLSNVAPTILALLGLPAPKGFTKDSIIEQ